MCPQRALCDIKTEADQRPEYGNAARSWKIIGFLSLTGAFDLSTNMRRRRTENRTEGVLTVEKEIIRSCTITLIKPCCCDITEEVDK